MVALRIYFIISGIANGFSAMASYISPISMQAETRIYTSSFVYMNIGIYTSSFQYMNAYVYILYIFQIF